MTEDSGKGEFRSPVEERHIDFILEEEFTADPGFLDFFLRKAAETAPSVALPARKQGGNSEAVRSAVTAAGETDVLVYYACEGAEGETAAILIESKIAAALQPNQTRRYRERGEAGKGTRWTRYWTCLVAPERYRCADGEFDARVSLESLRDYFSLQTGARARFRVRVLNDAITRAASIGVRRVDPVMTAFRAHYAALATVHFGGRGWEWDPARDAWADDTWFRFKRSHWPDQLQILHKAKAGLVHLTLPATDVSELARTLEQAAPGEAVSITAVQTGNSASLQATVPRIADFHPPVDDHALVEIFSAVEALGFYAERAKKQLITLKALAGARWGDRVHPDPSHTPLRMLEALLLGLMRTTAISFKADMPFPLPDMIALASTETKEAWYSLAGMYGGFRVRLVNEGKNPYLLTEHWSRVWDFGIVEHKVTLRTIELLTVESAVEIKVIKSSRELPGAETQ